MLRSTSWIWSTLILAGWLVAAPSAFAQGKNDPAHKVNDEAGLFSKDAVRSANEEIAAIKSAYKKDLVIETRKEGEPDLKKYRHWALEQAQSHRVNGIYIIITKQPKHFETIVGKETEKSGLFNIGDEQDLLKILTENLGKHPDDALRKSVDHVRDAFKHNATPKVAPAPAPAPAPKQNPGDEGVDHRAAGLLGGIGGIICIGLVVLLVVWVIFGLIRAMSGGFGGGGYGPGYGGGGYGYGGGGGGFLSSMIGGMFGAAAGMWMYNNMFGGHGGYNSGSYGGGAGGVGGTPGVGDAGANPEPTDVGAGYSAAGGDYGDDDKGGGDAGGGDDKGGGDAGGGDWGGGGDAGGGGGDAGGGDWGGGGGGDAGGGDWGGGGGGGDFGGGGGDFGGGGGGGDW